MNFNFFYSHKEEKNKNDIIKKFWYLAGWKYLNISLYILWVNLIQWYISYLKKQLDFLKENPMNIKISEKIIDLEDEMDEISIILDEKIPNTDWKWLREHITYLQKSIWDIKQEIIWNSKTTHIDTEEIQYNTRIYAWKALLDSWVSNNTIYKIQKNLHPDFSYDELTKDLIKSIKNTTHISLWFKNIDTTNPKIQKAIASIQAKEWSQASEFSLELRNDLHKKYGEAKNDELYYNNLWDLLKKKKESEIIQLHIVGFKEFKIISHKKWIWEKYTHIKIESLKIWSQHKEIYQIICNPNDIRAWHQARVAREEKNGITKIELLNINKIEIIENKEEKTSEKTWFWKHTKNYVQNSWNNLFSKKAA